jgi:DNA-binding PadR family transcriptional regulator
MTPIRVMILGTFLMLKRGLYGYELRRELEEWGAERWANISYSSLYFTLPKLAEEGLLVAVSSEQANNRPARIKYEVTPQGRATFHDWLTTYWTEVQPAFDPFQIALTFMPLLPQDALIAAMQARMQNLQKMIDALDWTRAKANAAFVPAHVEQNYLLLQDHLRTELKHVQAIIGRVQAGELP